MMLVMEPLKVLALAFKSFVTMKPLSAKELAAVSVVKTLNRSISPGLANRDENRLDPIVET